jgi:hypothetical protein
VREADGKLGRTLVRAAVLAASTAAAVLLAEAVLQVSAPRKLRVVLTDGREYVRHDPELGWTLRPGSSGRYTLARAYDVAVRIDSRGLRGPERDLAKAPGTKRILFLGDSFTFGIGVEESDTFARLLEDLPRVETFNAGVAGYGTTQELLWLRREGFAYRPDLVVLAFYTNDFWDNASGLRHETHRPAYVLKGGRLELTGVPVVASASSPLERLRSYLENHSYLYRLASATWEEGKKSARYPDLKPLRPVDRRPADMPRRLTGDVPAVELTDRLLSAMSDTCREHGVGFLVALLPSAWDSRPSLRTVAFGEGDRNAYEVALRLCRAHGLPFVDTRPALRALEEAGRPAYFDADPHFTPLGHRAVADLIRAAIARQGLL